MLKNISAAIRAVLSGMRAAVWKTIRIGDRLVSMLVPGQPPVSAVDAQDAAPAVAAVESMAALRGVANALAQGYSLTSAQAKSIPQLQAAWLQSMTRPELCRLIVQKDDAIRGHMRGKVMLKGIVPYHADAIRDVTVARSAKPQPKAVPRRTLRAVLAEKEGQALAA